MSKVLFVRGFSEDVHNRLTNQAKKDGITVASILEEAYLDWLRNKEEVPTKHYLILYSDHKSLNNLLKKTQSIVDDDYLQVCCGPESNPGVKFLKRHGWYDITINPYAEGIKKPEQYSSKVFDNLADIANKKPACMIGFMTEDVARIFSLRKANEVEQIYTEKKVGGVVFCPYDISKLEKYNLEDLITLISRHDKTFLVKDKDIFELNLGKSNFTKLFL